jgi:hypothetical protein
MLDYLKNCIPSTNKIYLQKHEKMSIQQIVCNLLAFKRVDRSIFKLKLYIDTMFVFDCIGLIQVDIYVYFNT